MEFMKSRRTDTKNPYVFQQDIRAYAGNFIFMSLDYRWMWQIEWVKLFSNELLYCSEKKLRKLILCRKYAVEKVSLIVSMKLNYAGIITILNEFMFDYINIFQNFMIMEQKIVNTNP